MLHQVDGFVAVGVQHGLGVGVEHYGGVGLVAGAVLLEGRVLLLEGLAELLNGELPEFVLQSDAFGTLAHGGEVLVVRHIGHPRDGDDVNLNGYVHNLEFY